LNDMAKNLVLWLVIAAVLFTVFENFKDHEPKGELNYSQFVYAVQENQVREVVIDDTHIRGIRIDNTPFVVVRPQLWDEKLVDDLLTHNVVIKGAEPHSPSLWEQLLVASFPILLFIAVFIFFMRQMQGGAG
jgi:cell division protease FtsH